MSAFSFTYHYPMPLSRARLGRLETPHGVVETPAFIFCATKAAIKGVTPQQMRACGTQFILSNTYHLMLQPGAEVVSKMGGLHRFMGWDGPMLTDSGGFQIFSLGHGSVAAEIKGNRHGSGMGARQKTLLNITEEGARFKSYSDGSMHLLTPEKSIEIQRLLGPDLVVVLDECTPFHVDKTYTQRSLDMSHRWGFRSLQEFQRHDDGRQSLYGIIQGGIYEDLREQACDFVNSQPFFGHAIGGSLGAHKEQMYDVVAMTAKRLDPNRPIHLLGIGGVRDIFEGVEQGIDTFDCVHPTRLARHGGALVRPPHALREGSEHLNLRNSACREDPNPIEPDCFCPTCTTYSRSYLHHLLKAQELLAMTLITMHNVAFMNRLLSAIRTAIGQGRLAEERKNWVPEKNVESSQDLAA
ncbi:MAG: tRNA guanosine(34) transglycosylase Tgt [Alphaproteobacteria bacterium]|nr:tRNA guanosine(34) transglycosylase Tgt [Alphaproteobacteria bacterium]